jgi:aspartate/tyrosine/aromatic aminotransferase
MADKDERKVDLGIGAYRTDEGKPLVLNVVKKVEHQVVNSNMNKEYAPIEGEPLFRTAAAKLMFGPESKAIKEKRIATVQSLSGTGSLRLGAEFVAQFLKGSAVLISKPTWGNHNAVFQKAGVKQLTYEYWNSKTRGLDMAGMLANLQSAPNKSIVLLHVCAHNPTGVDPTQAQWKQIAAVMKEKGHFPFFDCAYQGFATGDLSADNYPVRLFIELGFEMVVCQSFAKNFGLYAERIGALHVVVNNPAMTAPVVSQLAVIIRPMYSNPPRHGAHIVSAILNDPKLFAEWEAELKGMANRIKDMRTALLSELKKLKTPGDWSHIVTQIGMFSYTGLSPKQVDKMIKTHHVYMLGNGRISMAGVNTKNVAYLANAIHDCVTTVKA